MFGYWALWFWLIVRKNITAGLSYAKPLPLHFRTLGHFPTGYAKILRVRFHVEALNSGTLEEKYNLVNK